MEKHLFLTISHSGKAIPYGGGDRSTGSTNHGYKRLKGNPNLFASIPEAQDTDALMSALVRINDPQTAFFSIGCEKSCNTHEKGLWVRGYFELAFNYVELVADAQNYFKLFFEFNRFRPQVETFLPKSRYEFELEGAEFLDGPAVGFTLSVWITTTLFTTREEAMREWGDSLRSLVDFLEPFALQPNLTPIYTPGKRYAKL
jgi:hypothetical protein